MFKRTVLTCMMTLLCLVGPGRLEAQGIGAILDWLGRMSGPQFWQVGATATAGFEPGDPERTSGVAGRVAVMAGRSFASVEQIDPDAASINILTVKPTLEYAVLSGVVGFEAGVAFHRFSGDADPFWHVSFPIHAALRPFARVRGAEALKGLRIGASANFFQQFQAEDFGPLVVTVETDQTELVWGAFLNWEFFVF
jgi:hypothetical protein